MSYNAARVHLPRTLMLYANWSSRSLRTHHHHYPHNRLFFTNSSNHFFDSRKTLLYSTAGGIAVAGYVLLHSSAQCKSTNTTNSASEPSNAITLYQYQTCPFCCKTRAFLDYHDVQYNVVEVSPVTRKEIKFSKQKAVPFIVQDEVQVNDSSLIVSLLKSVMVNDGRLSLSQALDLYPEMSYTDSKGKTKTERANKYFIMFGEGGDKSGISLAERREEREWRQWVDDHLVHAIPPNIYRTPSEALETFDNVTKKGNFSAVERVVAKYVGAAGMYMLSKRLKKKYHLDDDVRESMYRYCDTWMKAVGNDRQFMGGAKPNLADLAVYGVLSAMEGLTTFNDIVSHTNISEWYSAVKKEIENKSIH